MKGIYKFFWDCGRQGNVEGIFVATADSVSNIIGRDINFGEILGKHSEVYGTIEEDEIKLVTTDENMVALFEEHNLSSGYNPLDYVEDEWND